MTAQRVWFLMMAVIIYLGIFLSAHQVHWFSYLPVIALVIAGVTGLCPSMTMLKKLGLK